MCPFRKCAFIHKTTTGNTILPDIDIDISETELQKAILNDDKPKNESLRSSISGLRNMIKNSVILDTIERNERHYVLRNPDPKKRNYGPMIFIPSDNDIPDCRIHFEQLKIFYDTRMITLKESEIKILSHLVQNGGKCYNSLDMLINVLKDEQGEVLYVGKCIRSTKKELGEFGKKYITSSHEGYTYLGPKPEISNKDKELLKSFMK